MAASHFIFDFEKWPLSKPVFQELIWQEMLHFHPEASESQGGTFCIPLHLFTRVAAHNPATSARVVALQQVYTTLPYELSAY